MSDLTDQQIEALDAAATPGPWRARTSMKLYNHTQADAEFIEAARSLVPSLLARAQKAEAEAERLRALPYLTGKSWVEGSIYEGVKAERDALAARLASAEAKLAAVEGALSMLEASGDHIGPPELHGFEDQIVALAVAAIRSIIRRTALAADTTPEPPSDLADVLGLTAEQREEHARQLADAFARISECER